MPISITCPSCSKRLKAKDTLAGKLVACPSCRTRLRIPQPETEDDAAGYLLQESTPSEDLPSSPERGTEELSERPLPRPRPVAPPKPAAPLLPVLKSEEAPGWLRHLHWLLVLALIPLAASLTQKDETPEE